MENITSNAPIRNSAMRRAVFLTLFPVLLAAMAGGFFPLAQYWEAYEAGKITKHKLDSLLLMEKNMQLLLVQLDSMNTKWENVIVLNEQWENESAATTKSNIELKTRELESQIQDGIRMIQKSKFGAMGEQAAYAHQLLLESRKAIWQLRLEKPSIPCPPNPGAERCQEDLQTISRKVSEAARDLAIELKSIQDASAQIRKLWGKHNKEIQQKIENSTEEIKTITNRLRDL